MLYLPLEILFLNSFCQPGLSISFVELWANDVVWVDSSMSDPSSTVQIPTLHWYHRWQSQSGEEDDHIAPQREFCLMTRRMTIEHHGWPEFSLQKPLRPLSGTILNHAANVSFYHLVCSSVWGWYAELMFSFVLVTLNSSCHKALVNTLSLSEIITWGNPCNLCMLLLNNWATDQAVNGCDNGKKWPYLENLSITTRIVAQFFYLGRPSMKSKLMMFQACVGTGKGCSIPGFLCVQI